MNYFFLLYIDKKNVCALNMKSLINPYIDFHPLIATINVKINQENVVGEMLITYMKLKEVPYTYYDMIKNHT